MSLFVAGWKVSVVVLLFVKYPQRDKSPINRIVSLGSDFLYPPGGHPSKRTNRIPKELDVVIVFTHTRHGYHVCAYGRLGE